MTPEQRKDLDATIKYHRDQAKVWLDEGDDIGRHWSKLHTKYADAAQAMLDDYLRLRRSIESHRRDTESDFGGYQSHAIGKRLWDALEPPRVEHAPPGRPPAKPAREPKRLPPAPAAVDAAGRHAADNWKRRTTRHGGQ